MKRKVVEGRVMAEAEGMLMVVVVVGAQETVAVLMAENSKEVRKGLMSIAT